MVPRLVPVEVTPRGAAALFAETSAVASGGSVAATPTPPAYQRAEPQPKTSPRLRSSRRPCQCARPAWPSMDSAGNSHPASLSGCDLRDRKVAKVRHRVGNVRGHAVARASQIITGRRPIRNSMSHGLPARVSPSGTSEPASSSAAHATRGSSRQMGADPDRARPTMTQSLLPAGRSIRPLPVTGRQLSPLWPALHWP